MRRDCALPMVLVTTPKLALFAVQHVPFGGPNCGWLKMLKNSVRNSMFARSPIVVFLNTAKSKLLMPCWRRVESTRDSLPKPQSGGAAKHDVLNHPPSFDTGLPDTDLSHPATTSGLSVPIPKPRPESDVPFPSLIFTGNPRWKVVTPPTPQPQTTLPGAP